jgi:hypothetical protein
MAIPGVGQLTALAFVAAIDDPSRIHRSRDVGAYLGLVPRRYQSGEADYVGGNSKCGDRRVRTLLYEAANVMLTRYKGQLKLKDWAFAIAGRSTIRKAQSLRRAASPSSCTQCCGTKPSSRRLRPSIHQTGDRVELLQGATFWEGADDGADCVACGQPTTDCDFNQAALRPAYPIKRPGPAWSNSLACPQASCTGTGRFLGRPPLATNAPASQPKGRLHMGAYDTTGRRLAPRAAHPSSLA